MKRLKEARRFQIISTEEKNGVAKPYDFFFFFNLFQVGISAEKLEQTDIKRFLATHEKPQCDGSHPFHYVALAHKSDRKQYLQFCCVHS